MSSLYFVTGPKVPAALLIEFRRRLGLRELDGVASCPDVREAWRDPIQPFGVGRGRRHVNRVLRFHIQNNQIERLRNRIFS